jgi:large-conductance mechanosensitive channel
MSPIESPASLNELPIALVKNMVTLATGGFGVVVGLAWTEFIKVLVADYLDPILGKNGSLISLFVYATIMTVLAVVVTMQLTQLQKRITPKKSEVVQTNPTK